MHCKAVTDACKNGGISFGPRFLYTSLRAYLRVLRRTLTNSIANLFNHWSADGHTSWNACQDQNQHQHVGLDLLFDRGTLSVSAITAKGMNSYLRMPIAIDLPECIQIVQSSREKSVDSSSKCDGIGCCSEA